MPNPRPEKHPAAKRLAEFLHGKSDLPTDTPSSEDGKDGWRQYRQLLSAYGGGMFVQFPRPFRRLFTWNEAWLLVHLINKADTVLSLERNAGWFYYTMDDLEFDTEIDQIQQSKLLKGLEEKGLIERRRLGVPPKRYFRINVFKLNELVGKATQEKEQRSLKRRKVRFKKFKKKVKDRLEQELDDERFGR
jgi:DNA-binding MarR family transcriptional regulator